MEEVNKNIYSSPGSVVRWLQEKRDFVLIGSQHDHYRPWRTLFLDVSLKSKEFRRTTATTRNFFMECVNRIRYGRTIPSPSAIILVPNSRYGIRIKDHLMSFDSNGGIREDFEINRPREKDDLVITTTQVFMDLVETKRMKCCNIQILLMCQLEEIEYEEHWIQTISTMLPPKENRSTIIYSSVLHRGIRNTGTTLLKSNADLIWLPQLLGSMDLEERVLSLYEYMQVHCQTENGLVNRILVLFCTKPDAEFVSHKIKELGGAPGIKYYPIFHSSLRARQVQWQAFRSCTSPVLFVNWEDMKDYDPDCVDMMINFNIHPDSWIIRQHARGRLAYK